MKLDDKAVGITWEDKDKANKLNEENQYLAFRRRIINEVIDKIFGFCVLIMVVCVILIICYYFGLFSEIETIPLLVVIESVWLHLESLPMIILLLIIILIISLVMMVFVAGRYVSESQVIVLGKEKKR